MNRSKYGQQNCHHLIGLSTLFPLDPTCCRNTGQLFSLPDVGRSLVGFRMSEEFPHHLLMSSLIIWQFCSRHQVERKYNSLKLRNRQSVYVYIKRKHAQWLTNENPPPSIPRPVPKGKGSNSPFPTLTRGEASSQESVTNKVFIRISIIQIIRIIRIFLFIWYSNKYKQSDALICYYQSIKCDPSLPIPLY
jgi:hypothetical protein